MEFPRLFTAAQCRVFADEVDRDSEMWSTYKKWKEVLDSLQILDSIITFNYDPVLERLGFQPWLPHDVPTNPEDRDRDKEGRWNIPVLKLHGSVEWEYVKGDDGIRKVRHTAEMMAISPDVAIAAPGRSKSNACNGPLKPLWDAAEQLLRDAATIIFVGYRFPESDAEARTKLLGAIEENQNKRVDVHVVLGPTRTDDAVRLEGLLRYSLTNAGRVDEEKSKVLANGETTFRVHMHPLYAQDLLGLWRQPLNKSEPGAG
jgi:hypothetical protein